MDFEKYAIQDERPIIFAAALHLSIMATAMPAQLIKILPASSTETSLMSSTSKVNQTLSPFGTHEDSSNKRDGKGAIAPRTAQTIYRARFWSVLGWILDVQGSILKGFEVENDVQ